MLFTSLLRSLSVTGLGATICYEGGCGTSFWKACLLQSASGYLLVRHTSFPEVLDPSLDVNYVPKLVKSARKLGL